MSRVLRWVATPSHLLGLVAALGMVCYWPVLQGMAAQWYFDQDMGHGFLVPVAAGWIGWQQRKRLGVARPSAWGLVFVLAGAALQLAGAVGAGLFVGSLGLACALVGVLLAAGGLGWLRELSFPLFLVVFMLPKLQFVYNEVTLPLQLLASQMAAAVARVAGTSVVREGNILLVAGHRIAVEEACNGIRYLLSLAFVALLWGHMAGLRGWRRALMGLFAVPLAIVVNGLRVAAVAVMCRYNYPLAVGTFHDASGWAALALALVLLVGAERAIRLLPAGAGGPEPPPPVSAAVRPVWLMGAALIFAVQLPLVQAVPRMEVAPRVPALALFPEQLGAWRMTGAGTLAADETAILKADDTLLRYYAGPGGAGAIELRVAYYGSERGGLRQPHSPKVCLPAGGWMPTESRTVGVEGGEVNLYQVAKGEQRATVLYWYQTPYQTAAGEWTMKARIAENGILHRRTDVALVRLVGEPEAALAFAPLVMAEMRTRLR
ncbi:MAG: exosortase C-terminal domain/associated protein EpsI [Bryobacteraceae bacterium]